MLQQHHNNKALHLTAYKVRPLRSHYRQQVSASLGLESDNER